MREIKLEQIKHAVSQRIGRERLSRMRLDMEWVFDVDAMVMRLEQSVLSERLTDESVRWPATWWDAFKVRWMPQWWLRRWPAKYAHADFTVYRGYPDVSMPDHRHTLSIQRQWPEA